MVTDTCLNMTTCRQKHVRSKQSDQLILDHTNFHLTTSQKEYNSKLGYKTVTRSRMLLEQSNLWTGQT